jgi:protein gp37
VFCASLADVFDEEVPDSWRDELFQLIVETPNLDWLLLTKRVFKAKEYLFTKPTLANVWLGASVENQEAVFDRLPILGSIPAQVLFISAEPLLGPIDVRPYLLDSVKFKSGSLMGEVVGQKLDWVICGGESGEGYRGMNPVWAMNLYAQCQSAGTAFFMKQGSAVKSGCQGSIPNGLWDIKEFPKFGRLI